MSAATKRVGVVLLTLIVVPLAVRQPAFAELDATQQPKNMKGVSQAALAARLAHEGEKRQSPILLLAAAELLGDLTQAPAPPGIKVVLAPTGAAANSSHSSPFDPAALVEKARALARQDQQLAALVDRRAEQLGQRGIPSSAIGDRPTIDVQGGRFVLLVDGNVSPGEMGRIENVPFVAAEPAIVAVVSEAANALRMGIVDMGSGLPVAQGEPLDQTMIAAGWTPEEASPHAILIQNRSNAPARVMVLANVSEEGGGGGIPAPPAPFNK